MIEQPAPPPAPPGVPPNVDAVRLEAAAQALEAAAGRTGAAGLAERAAGMRQEAERLRADVEAQVDVGAPGSVSVVKNARGHVVVTGADGRTVTYDPSVGLDEDAIRDMVQTALAPPPIPEPPRGGPPESVMIVGIVFSFLFLITLIVSVTRMLGRRSAAAPGQAPPADVSARLARIEQAVDAVAIEVERIAEAERYSARLLTERLPERAAAPGQALAGPAPTLDAIR